MRVGIVSLGCAKNLINSEQMMHLLKTAGFEVTSETEGVDVVVLNTCGFIESAKMEAIETILELSEAKRQGLFDKLIVTGCLVQRYKNEIFDELPEIDGAVGVGSFADIVSAVNSVTAGGQKPALFGDINAPVDETPRMLTSSPVWTYLKIAEGCDNRCAFCAIPDIRGKFRSRPMENIVQEARDLAAQGIKEVIIVAQDSTRYGVDRYGTRKLSELLEALCKIDELKWVRLHYLYPSEIDEKLVDTIAKNGKILKYADIPIQHISNKVLKKMRRRGSGDETRELIRNLRAKIPGIVIRTSVITGHPGEEEAEFEELCKFLREMKIERAGVFPFSPEEGTAAETMARADPDTAAHRAELIAGIQSQIMDEFNKSRIGTVTSVLIEGHNGENYYGRSYAESPEIDGQVFVIGEGIEINDFANVRMIGIENGEPIGELIVK